ncbi:hypothetical protein SD81_012105 [Tolypothrix campylonemoides VB511288]|nr:hypothetical protein SD81_012105 [Tolypothrix campylonemoides VB511288]
MTNNHLKSYLVFQANAHYGVLVKYPNPKKFNEENDVLDSKCLRCRAIAPGGQIVPTPKRVVLHAVTAVTQQV